VVVGLCHIRLIARESRSLKNKRAVVKKVTERLKGRFNISVAEVGSHDLWQRAEIGFVAVGVDERTVNSLLDRAVDFVEDLGVAELVDHAIEITHCSLLEDKP